MAVSSSALLFGKLDIGDVDGRVQPPPKGLIAEIPSALLSEDVIVVLLLPLIFGGDDIGMAIGVDLKDADVCGTSDTGECGVYSAASLF